MLGCAAVVSWAQKALWDGFRGCGSPCISKISKQNTPHQRAIMYQIWFFNDNALMQTLILLLAPAFLQIVDRPEPTSYTNHSSTIG
jgi:hypothetical protein